MSKKSLLSILLDKPFWRQEDLFQLKRWAGYDSQASKTFAGWTYWGHIGEVYSADNYDNLFSTLDNAAQFFFPIIYKFKEIKCNKKSISAFYYPDDIEILKKIRGYMEKNNINFLDSPQKPFFSIYIETAETIVESGTVKTFVPSQTEIVFSSACILKIRRKNTRLYHRTPKILD